MIRAIVFDAYGTLLDVLGIQRFIDARLSGNAGKLGALWRDKQLQYTWLRTLSGRYADFRTVTADALDYAAAALGLVIEPKVRAELMAQYEKLSAFGDAAPALAELASAGPALCVLSNGTPAMLDAAFANAGLATSFATILSVDAVRRYKPSPEAYRLATDLFRVPAADLLMVSSNGWDIAGAAAFGMRTFWVNRAGAPVERLEVEPDGIGRTLTDLPRWLSAQP